MNRSLRVLVPTVLVAGGVSVWSAPPMAGAATSCTITQITDTDDTGNFANAGPVISADGTKIAFESDQDHTGFNGDGNQEIVLYDVTADSFVRVSSTTGGTFANRTPAINADGTRVVWSTDRSIVGGNLDGNREIVRWTRIGGFSAVQYVTNTSAPVSNRGPSVDAAGDDIVYSAGTDTAFEIVHFRTNGSVTTPLTDTQGGESVQPFVNAPGTHVVFSSNGTIDGSAAGGGYEIFLRSLAGGPSTLVTDVDSDGFSVSPVMSDDTRRVALVSSAPLLGVDGASTGQAYLVQRAGPVTSLLSPGESGEFGLGSVAMNARGTRVVFESDGDHAGMNADGNFEIFVHDFGPTGERITQITDDAASSGEIDVDASGTRIVFSSRGDHAGLNADGGREIFLATCGAPPAPSGCRGLLVTVDVGRGEEPTRFADVIRGTSGADTVSAGPGDDVFCGLGGADVFDGGLGKDWADGGAGPDRLDGGRGADRLRGGKGADRLNGGRADDVCLGGPGRDRSIRCETIGGVP
jgi:Tol biopolymer transport system component